MRIVVTFLLNAGLNFGVGLVIAALMGPDLYGRYAVIASTGSLLATALFEWLRLSTARFYGETQRGSVPALRPSLDACYHVLTAVLVVGGVLALGLPGRFGVTPSLAGAVVLAAVANGGFDYCGALARARFMDRDYAGLVIGKGVLGLAAAAAAAQWTHDPAAVLAAQAVGSLVAILPSRGALADPGRAPPARSLIRRFAAYGLPVVAANVVFQAILLFNRSVAASRLGFATAGHLSLATDIELRLFLAVGAALDVLLFQLAVRGEAVAGPSGAAQQLRRNIVDVAAVLLLLGVLFAAVLPAFTALIVPERFRDGFVPLALAVLPGILLFCFGQFAINPVFQMAHRTRPIILGALSSAAVDGLGLLLVPATAGPIGIAAVHSVSLGGGTLCLAWLAHRDAAIRPRLQDAVGLLAATAVAGLAVWPLRALPAPLVLGTAAVIGPLGFAAVLLLGDVGVMRQRAAWLRACVLRLVPTREVA
ncbi:lipopolysaccharide biosynthesis protein [Lichenihabitans sp. Uapishka_5]|uniref:lipopolysaccharide biosynthesis protein n=1 Tax=Lichenihabitans sp. Uapishka_5 TaxID=3037302 RepID=UPI0029E80C6D|nr:lipopolysaccharide biosynthesis protein [Lichenihabitans sp. Uapishka_5]MDX7950434.1 lipopolysaccharide biosynthesis protein [Lichenihabitans sp. Uapishka_5]